MNKIIQRLNKMIVQSSKNDERKTYLAYPEEYAKLMEQNAALIRDTAALVERIKANNALNDTGKGVE